MNGEIDKCIVQRMYLVPLPQVFHYVLYSNKTYLFLSSQISS